MSKRDPGSKISAGAQGASATHQGVLPEQRGDRVPLENRCGLVTSAVEGLLCRGRGRVEFPHSHCANKSGPGSPPYR